MSCWVWNLTSNVVQYTTKNAQDSGKLVVLNNKQCFHVDDERVLYLMYYRANRLDFLEWNCEELELRATTTMQYQ